MVYILTVSALLQLDNVRNVLIRLEETIIFALIERAQFRRNAIIYQPGAFGPELEGLSLLAYCLRETERVHARMRRYTSPDEHPFSRDLPAPVLPTLAFRDNPLHPNRINLNARIMAAYRDEIVPLICAEGDDEQYGSSSVCDVAALPALSRRIHYGKFVAESKYRAQPAAYDPLIRAGDRAGLLQAITDATAERDVLRRVGRKARSYTREITATTAHQLFDPRKVVDIYRRWIMPMNKDVQVQYLLQRNHAVDSETAQP
jgi:chorismate mutase